MVQPEGQIQFNKKTCNSKRLKCQNLYGKIGNIKNAQGHSQDLYFKLFKSHKMYTPER